MRRLLTYGLLLVLAACTVESRAGKDGYVFEKKEFEKTSIKVEMITYKTKAELLKAAKQLNITVESNRELAAFATLRPSQNACTIHTMDPSKSYEPEFMGHELAHCFYGRWHP